MSQAIRLVIEEAVPDSYGLAADEVVALRCGSGSSPPTLRLYTYRSHAALVGRFQNIANELHLDYCAAEGISVNCRPTGGGAIIMGDQQLGIALCIPGGAGARYGNARALMAQFSAGILTGLKMFGVEGLFARKNDLEVHGRKIAGLGMHRTSTGGLLFHGSLLVDLDVAFMLRVLNTPFEKISDKQVRTVEGRITTLAAEASGPVDMPQVREAVARGFSEETGTRLEPGLFSADELVEIEALQESKYQRNEWIHQRSAVADGEGFARRKTPAGLIGARVTTAGGQLKAVYLEGDFFCSEKAIAAVEGALRWRPAAHRSVRAAVSEVYGRYGDDLGGLPIDAVVQVVVDAAAKAVPLPVANSEPYGCFISPGELHEQPAG